MAAAKRLVRFLDVEGRDCWGVLADLAEQPKVGDMIKLSPHPITMEVAAGGSQAKIFKLLPALPFRPPSIICIGLNYKQHAAECGLKEPELPLVFMKNAASLCGDGDAIIVPKCAQDPPEVNTPTAFFVNISKLISVADTHLKGYPVFFLRWTMRLRWALSSARIAKMSAERVLLILFWATSQRMMSALDCT